jgi:hypothetical protein
MVLLEVLFFGAAAAMDVVVTCASAPKYYTIDGMANRQLSIDAGDSINFHFDAGCSGYPMQIQRIDGTPYPSNGPTTSLVTSAATPECLVYASMTQPLTMTGTISVVGGTPCGAAVTAATTLYNRPVITPLPAPIPTTTLYPLPTSIYASGSVSLYSPTLVCPARACPALLPCVSPAYQMTDTMADGCPGCPYCFTPVAVPLPSLPVLSPLVCPVRSCPPLRPCLVPTVSHTELMGDGCPGCPRCVVPNAPCVGLYCLPCCPLIRIEGQACRNCLSFF